MQGGIRVASGIEVMRISFEGIIRRMCGGIDTDQVGETLRARVAGNLGRALNNHFATHNPHAMCQSTFSEIRQV